MAFNRKILSGGVGSPAMREAYWRLTEDNGRPGKVAMAAVMRRVLVILNAIASDNAPWRGRKRRSPAAMPGSPFTTSRDEIQDAPAAAQASDPAGGTGIFPLRDVIQGGAMPRGRKPKGERTMTGAERQALYLARQNRAAAPSDPAGPAKTAKVSRPRRRSAALAELKVLIGEYANWYETMPEHFRDSPTGQALETIETVQLPKGFGRD